MFTLISSDPVIDPIQLGHLSTAVRRVPAVRFRFARKHQVKVDYVLPTAGETGRKARVEDLGPDLMKASLSGLLPLESEDAPAESSSLLEAGLRGFMASRAPLYVYKDRIRMGLFKIVDSDFEYGDFSGPKSWEFKWSIDLLEWVQDA